jgi:cholesterol transport system auxiliary component
MITLNNQAPPPAPTARAPASPLRRIWRRFTPILVGLSALALSASACALTSKSDPILPRYFSPERSDAIAKPGFAAGGVGAELRIGTISAASHLDERMVFRDSTFELGYYQEKRWTEAPEEYLRRRLERALFEERGLRHVVGGAAPMLVVELTAFEEIRKPKRIARVQVTVRLQDARLVRWEQTLTVDSPVATSSDDEWENEMVEAVGVALVSVVNQIADRVTKELEPQVAATPENPKKAGP